MFQKLNNFIKRKSQQSTKEMPSASSQLDEIYTKSKAQYDERIEQINSKKGLPGRSFIAPNEKDPNEAKSLIKNKKVPSDMALISVGTERTLNLPYKSSLIVQADIDPSVTYYNLFNNEMIKASKDRKTYKELRDTLTSPDGNKNIENFQSKLQEMGYKAKDNEIDISDPKYIEHMMEVRGQVKETTIKDENNKEVTKKEVTVHRDMKNYEKNTNDNFSDTYLHNDKEFKRIKKLADKGKIVPRLMSIYKENDVDQLLDDLKKSGNEKIGIVDPSNAWQEQYRGDPTPEGQEQHNESDECLKKLKDAIYSDKNKQGAFLITDHDESKKFRYHAYSKDEAFKSNKNGEITFDKHKKPESKKQWKGGPEPIFAPQAEGKSNGAFHSEFTLETPPPLEQNTKNEKTKEETKEEVSYSPPSWQQKQGEPKSPIDHATREAQSRSK